MSKGQTLQDPFLNSLRKDRIPVSIFLVNGIKLQGQIESFDQYVVLLRNTVSQMVYKHAISTVVPARNPRTTGLTGTMVGTGGFSHPTGVTGITGGFEQGQGFGTIPRGTISSGLGGGALGSHSLASDKVGFGQADEEDFGYDNQPRRGFSHQTSQDSYTQGGFGEDSTNLDNMTNRGFGTAGFDKSGFDKVGFESSGFNDQGFSEHGFGNNRNFSNDRGFGDAPAKNSDD